MIKEFKEFMLRGNVMDMAVGVVIGGAFTAIVTNIVAGLITPLIALLILAITGSHDTKFDMMNVTYQGVTFNFGAVFTAVITFIITGIVLFLIMKSVNRLRTIRAKEEENEEEDVIHTELDYLEEIRDLLAKKENEE